MIPDMGSAKAYDVIVAVDAKRTRNINELEDSLRYVQAGEVIYLTIIRDGRRDSLAYSRGNSRPALSDVADDVIPVNGRDGSALPKRHDACRSASWLFRRGHCVE